MASRAAEVLRDIADGRLARLPVTLRFWDGSSLPSESDGHVVVIRDPRAVAHLLRAPNQVGLARAWVSGLLDVVGDLEAVTATRSFFAGVELRASERARLAWAAVRVAGPRVLRRPPLPAAEASTLRGRLHSLARDRAAVQHHYDVSNRFFELLLGPSMVYSCAYFHSGDEPLEVAQSRKLDLICRKLRLEADERLLDIGCGWGSLLVHAAKHYGVRGVGVTLSEPQARWARERIAALGLGDRVEVRVADYREIADGPFDKIASVGMYEHVGRTELDRYADVLHGLVKPGGLVLNHGIARLASAAPHGDTFISRYVFPDGELHPVTEIIRSMQSAGLEVRDVESLREHYPLTLRRWLGNLRAHRDEAVAEAGPERERAWRLYMTASAQAFEAGEITVYQVLGARAGAPHGLPLARAELLVDPTSA